MKRKSNKPFCSRMVSVISYLCCILAILIPHIIYAANPGGGGAGDVTLSDISSNIDKSVTSLAVIFSDVALVAGVGFVLASFFKFHQHRQNPTQVPVSQGISLLLIGAALIMFPHLLTTSQRAVFGTKASITKVGGDDIKKLIGGNK